MVHGAELGGGGRPGGSIVVDVTSLIGAEDYIVSQNRRSSPADPFAKQCFVEMVQSIIFMPMVYVVHPVLAEPRADDYGQRPLLLRVLFDNGLVAPLVLQSAEQMDMHVREDRVLEDLSGSPGFKSLARFTDQAAEIDRTLESLDSALLERMKLWTDFQDRRVRDIDGHHRARIPTSDGVEDDGFGVWARAAAVVLDQPLRQVIPGSEGKHLLAVLARGLKYQVRATAAGLTYQAHPIRRDFSVTFDFTRGGASENFVYRLIKSIRDVGEALPGGFIPESTRIRLELLELELPLLGGRLWEDSERGRYSDEDWIRGIVRRVGAYRSRARDLRHAIAQCVTEDDYLRLSRDVEDVKQQFLERAGLKRIELSVTERDLIGGVSSVVEAAPGVPKVSGLWMGARAIGKRAGYHGGRPFQKFLYREFVEAWKRAGV